MSYRMRVVVDDKKVLSDVFAFLTTKFSDPDMDQAFALVDYENDAQHYMLYNMFVAAHARLILMQHDANAMVVAGHWKTRAEPIPYADVDFASKEEALVFRLRT